MGSNFHNPWVDNTTKFRTAEMNVPLSYLDRAITFLKNNIITCDGDITYNSATGVLTWSGLIHIYFNNTTGVATHNYVAAGSLTLASNEFAYVGLSETNDTAITLTKAALATGSASNFLAYNVVVLGLRIGSVFFGILWELILKSVYVEKSLLDANTVLVANTDNTPVALALSEQRVLGRLSGGQIKGLNATELATLIGYDLVAAPATDHEISGQKIALVAGAAVAFGDVGRIDTTGKVVLAQADIIDHAWGLFMCADASIALDATGDWLLPGGIVRDDTWNWTVGRPVYLSTVGTAGNTLTQVAPSGTDNVIQVIGMATHANRIYFDPQMVQVEHV